MQKKKKWIVIKVIDFHSHIIPSIDDGSRNVQETFKMIEEAKEVGFKKIISTSHYLNDLYEVDENDRKAIISAINSKISNIEIYLGSEIYVTHRIVDFIETKKASTINGSRYVLFELPMKKNIFDLKEIIFKLLENRYIPIIAHPERYEYVQENPNMLIDLIKMGVLFQGNYGSVIGIYGKKAEKTIKKLLKANIIHFLGSDVHRANSLYPQRPKAIEEIKNIVSKEVFEAISTKNAESVLNDEKIEIFEPQKIKFF